MHRRWLLAGISAALVAGYSTNASAEDANGFGRKGQLILSADRLLPVFSFTSASISETNGNTTIKSTTSGSSIALLWGDESTLDGQYKVHSIPRVGFDFTIIDRLTLGGSIALAFGVGGTQSVKTTTNGTERTVEIDAPRTTVIGFSPRVGYVLPLSTMFAFWPRGGFSFYSVRSQRTLTANNNTNNDNTDTDSNTVFSLDLDPQFVLTPMEHFFFTAGPLLNIPLTGTSKNEVVNGPTTVTTSRDLTLWHFGITAGLGGWFDL